MISLDLIWLENWELGIGNWELGEKIGGFCLGKMAGLTVYDVFDNISDIVVSRTLFPILRAIAR
ncbi:MAG: hypothetical protein F6K47_24690 [Symploca sp. SIO2E6]|nr:hypothetical protein [Symploca sp. SIO2E6]